MRKLLSSYFLLEINVYFKQFQKLFFQYHFNRSHFFNYVINKIILKTGIRSILFWFCYSSVDSTPSSLILFVCPSFWNDTQNTLLYIFNVNLKIYTLQLRFLIQTTSCLFLFKLLIYLLSVCMSTWVYVWECVCVCMCTCVCVYVCARVCVWSEK